MEGHVRQQRNEPCAGWQALKHIVSSILPFAGNDEIKRRKKIENKLKRRTKNNDTAR